MELFAATSIRLVQLAFVTCQQAPPFSLICQHAPPALSPANKHHPHSHVWFRIVSCNKTTDCLSNARVKGKDRDSG